MSIKFLVLGGGGGIWVLGGGGWKCRFYFYGREDFSDFCVLLKQTKIDLVIFMTRVIPKDQEV